VATPQVRFVTLRPPKILTDQTNVNIDPTPATPPYRVAAKLIDALIAARGPSNWVEVDVA
jgi:hypothetical protein